MGLAPLLAWCLEAVVPSNRFENQLPEALRRSAARMEFVVSQAFPGQPGRAGWLLTLWLAGGIWLVGWMASSGAWVIVGHFITFCVWTLLLYVGIDIRGRVGQALKIREALSRGDLEGARARLPLLSRKPSDHPNIETEPPETDKDIAAATISSLFRGSLGAVAVPLFWAAPLGAAGAITTRCLHLLAEDHRKDQSKLWAPLRTTGRLIEAGPAWLMGLLVQPSIRFAGGSSDDALSGFLNATSLPYPDRVLLALNRGLGLNLEARELDPDRPPNASDIHRACIVLWVLSAAFALVSTTVCCIVYWKLL